MPQVQTKIRRQSLQITASVAIVLSVIAWLAVTGIQANKSYYVTINELQGLGSKAYTRHLRVAGNVQPGSINHTGAGAHFVLVENDKRLPVDYDSTEPPPDTFKDNSQALAIGMYGRDGVFHATELQAKCASKYAPAPAAAQSGSKPAPATAALVPER